MPKSAPSAFEATKRNAEARFHELVGELKLLTSAFPHLREAYDPEELPVPFLLKRGADRADRQAEKQAATRTTGVRRTTKSKK